MLCDYAIAWMYASILPSMLCPLFRFASKTESCCRQVPSTTGKAHFEPLARLGSMCSQKRAESLMNYYNVLSETVC